MKRGSEEYIAFYGDDEDIKMRVLREEAFEEGIEKGQKKGYKEGQEENRQYFIDFISHGLTKSEVKKRLYKEIEEDSYIETLPIYKIAIEEFSREAEIKDACKEAFNKGFKYGRKKGNSKGLKAMQLYFRELLLQDLTIEEIKELLIKKRGRRDLINGRRISS